MANDMDSSADIAYQTNFLIMMLMRKFLFLHIFQIK